jgi:hypothetical protein
MKAQINISYETEDLQTDLDAIVSLFPTATIKGYYQEVVIPSETATAQARNNEL